MVTVGVTMRSWFILGYREATAVAIPLHSLALRELATLSPRRLLHEVSNYRNWKATACLNALQRDENELPLTGILGNSCLLDPGFARWETSL
jgi:hypothetical protein